MTLVLKISCCDKVDSEILTVLRDGLYHYVKLSSTKVQIVRDRRDARLIDSLKNIKIILEKKNGGVLILLGNLQCDHRMPFGAAFFITRVINESSDYKSINGVEARVKFALMNDVPTDNNELERYMQNLINEPNFIYNIGQFDEFMQIFEYYKKISDELNNNISFEIKSKSEPYYFVPFDVKEFESEFKEEVKDENGVLKGYKFDEVTYIYLKNEVKEHVRLLTDIHIKGGKDQFNRIKRVGDNVYLSNSLVVSEKDVKNLKQFIIVNIKIQKDEVVISGELKNDKDYDEEYEYLNLYDMGQKIKVDSIENSLRLINQGASGAAVTLLEYLIGDKTMPNNSKFRLKREENTKNFVEELNESQKRAFFMAIDGSPVSLIKGPPGTGKTHVINAIVQYITKILKEKVIISSQTHIAIDNVLDKLVENYDIVVPNRITNRRNKYSGDEIDLTLYRTWGKNFLNHNKRARNGKLAQAVEKSMEKFRGEERFQYAEMSSNSDYSVIGATTTTSAIAGRKGLEVLKGYDWLIIDEVSKCPITEVLRYLPYVKKIIMVGDDFQLAPLLEFTKDDVKDLPSYDEEMFERLQSIYEQSVFAKTMEKAKKAGRLVLLNENYRSVKDILSVYNVFYDGELIGRREEVRPNKVRFSTREDGCDYENKDIFFVEVVNGQEAREGTSRFNLEEIAATEFILKDLMKTVINPENVSVSAIFPYAAQISKFQKNNLKLINEAKKLFKSFEIDTVDAFQGKETDIVLVNTVVADSSQKNFLNDFRRINVSMSRAKDKLFIFGNNRVLRRIKMNVSGGHERNYFNDIIDFVKSTGTFITYNGGKIEYGNKSKSSINLA